MKKKDPTLTVAQKSYIETHFKEKTPEELAADTGLTLLAVRGVLRKLEESGFQPAGDGKSLPARAGFAVHHGTDSDGNESKVGSVSMTKQASEKGDDFRQGKVPKRNQKFFDKRVKRGIHVMDPNKPVY